MILENKLSNQIKQIKPSGIRKFFDLANTMEDVISLGVGEPDFDTPWNICEAAIYSIEKGKTFYTSNQGLPELCKEIKMYMRRRFQLNYDANKEIMVTVGGSEAIDLALRSIVNPEDEVIVLSPCYVAYEPLITLSYAKVVTIPLKEEYQFKLKAHQLEAAISEKTKAIILNFPSNPTGGVMNKEDYEAIIPIIKKHELIVISDEIYAELSYEEKHISLANFESVKNQVIVINGFSKAFAMTGWRLGFVCANQIFISAMLKIHQYMIMSAPTLAQYGAIEALKQGDAIVSKMKQAYFIRRNYLVNRLNEIGLKTHMPQGAFYVFANITSTRLSSLEFCEKLLQMKKVACVPGTAFGEAGEGYIRISYAYSMEEIKFALEKIEEFLNDLQEVKNKRIDK